jgi:hypothetical protein
MTTTTQLIALKQAAQAKMAFWNDIHRRATMNDADAYQDLNERTHWANNAMRQMISLAAELSMLDSDIAEIAYRESLR